MVERDHSKHTRRDYSGSRSTAPPMRGLVVAGDGEIERRRAIGRTQLEWYGQGKRKDTGEGGAGNERDGQRVAGEHLTWR